MAMKHATVGKSNVWHYWKSLNRISMLRIHASSKRVARPEKAVERLNLRSGKGGGVGSGLDSFGGAYPTSLGLKNYCIFYYTISNDL